MDRDIQGQPTADYLWNVKRIVPFLKVDKGLAAEKDGVQLMKPMPGLAALLEKAKAKRIFGTKMRSVINQANVGGHQGNREPTVRNRSPDHRRRTDPDRRAGSGHSLPGKGQGRGAAQGGYPRRTRPAAVGAIGHAQAHAAGTRRLSIPTSSDIRGSCELSRCRAVMRGRRPTSACDGTTASWRASRGPSSKGLTAQQSDAEYNAMLDASIQSIFEASKT